MALRSLAIAATAVALAVALPAQAAAPPGWVIAGSSPSDYEYAVDTTTAASGQKSALIVAKHGARNEGFGTLMQTIAADNYRGARWRLSGYLRTEGANRAQMWMRVDGSGGKVLAFDNMDSRPVTGTTGWTHYDIVLDVPSDSVDIAFGFFLLSSGKVWGDDFKLEKVDATVAVTAPGPTLSRAPANPDFEDTASGQAAVWVPRKLRFAVFMAKGSCADGAFNPCDNVRDDITALLRRLGARDVVADNYEITFSVLQPAESATPTSANLPRVVARWEKVTLTNLRQPLDSGISLGVDDLSTRILPLFGIREPLPKLGGRVTVEVLRPVSAAGP